MQWVKEQVACARYVPMLHLSPLHVKAVGFLMLVGHPLFWFAWAVWWLPQANESPALRIFCALAGFLLTVLGSCVGIALMLGLFATNMRREQLSRTRATMGVMAHELRTPLATMALIGDALRGTAGECDGNPARKLEQLASRLHTLVRNMNHQLDMQITNAQLTELPLRAEKLSAADVVRTAVANYPFRTTREKECVRVIVHSDFVFRGSSALFAHVIDNLVKNGLRSLAANGSELLPGDLDIDVGSLQSRGIIAVADRGMGIEPELHRRIFEPFFSTNRGSGHGLGLAFCQQVVHGARGAIRVRSAPGGGARFTIELPLASRA